MQSGNKIDLDLIPLESWFGGLRRPLFIAGPCSAESEEQMMATAAGIAEKGRVQILRAGIWKPRTRPDSFEGMGEKALPWLKNAGKKYGLLTATEVANSAHAELALKAGIDVLWIGARTTVNPFSVQEIADALRGVDVPVFVKNPIHPDLQLWLGALERMNRAGIQKLGAIHRGFSSFEHSPYRNAPKWELAIELKSYVPGLPVVCDPSHISGNRDLIPLVAQKALDLDMAGLMIETHIEPDLALSDARQQVNPAGLEFILSHLIVRHSTTENPEFRNILEMLRGQIDELDDEIVQKLAARMNIAEKIGEYKKENQVTILQVQRWDEIIAKRKIQAEKMGLSSEFIRSLLDLIHQESIRRQTGVMNSQNKSV